MKEEKQKANSAHIKV